MMDCDLRIARDVQAVTGQPKQEHQCGWLARALVLAATGTAAVTLALFVQVESMTVHMATHAVAMNLFAPVLCLIAGFRQCRRHILVFASALQLSLLAFWHMLPVTAYDGPVFRFLMHASLVGAACLFWGSILGSDRRQPLEGVAALLITGKLVCLAGAILVFAPRPFHLGASHTHDFDAVQDQQLAGLIMLATCPLAYMSAAITLFWRWLSGIGATASAKVLA